MLRMKALNAEAHEALAARQPFPPQWNDMAELERVADAWIADWLEARRELARAKGALARGFDKLDRLIRTDKPEHLDDPSYPVQKKVRIVRGLHACNMFYRSYHRYVRMLTPLVEEVARREDRPARLLELASGSGDLALEIARLAQERDLPVTVIGSDYIPAYIERAAARAEERGLSVEFRLVNAFEMRDIEPGEFDIVAITGSTHHFTPGQLAVLIAQSRRVATTAFVSIDARRGLDNLLGIVPVPALTLQLGLLHDAWISGRKFMSEYELEHIARIAAPDASIGTAHAGPWGCTTVRFDRGAANLFEPLLEIGAIRVVGPDEK